VVRVDD